MGYFLAVMLLCIRNFIDLKSSAFILKIRLLVWKSIIRIIELESKNENQIHEKRDIVVSKYIYAYIHELKPPRKKQVAMNCWLLID